MIIGNLKPNRTNRRRLCVSLGFFLLLLVAFELPAANFIVRMQGTRFVPRDITITVGDSITWTNLDFSGHDSVSGTNGTSSGFWRTPLFGLGGSATVTFTNIPPRSYGYYCTPHVFAGMVGSVTVLPGNTPPVASFLAPTDGALVPAGSSLPIQADATDADGRVARVDFFVDGALLSSDSAGPFTAVYANPTVGNHTLRVAAVDDRGATSSPVSVTITALLPPTIVTPPQSRSAIVGDQVTFDVVAEGAPPLDFQWHFGGSDIANATNSSYTIAPVTSAFEGDYTVTVRNPVGEVTSSTATLTLSNAPPVIDQVLSPLAGAKFPEGASVTVLAEASDRDGIVTRVEFRLGGELRAVATNAPWTGTIANIPSGQLTIGVVAVDDRGAFGDTFDRIIQVLNPPGISFTQPQSGTVFTQLNTINLTATTTSDAVITNVEFFAGELELGSVVPPPIPNPDPILFAWVPAALGAYTLRAAATDEFGQRTTSAPVAVLIHDPADAVRPTISLTSSLPNLARVRNTNVVWLTGTASDNLGLSRVEIFQMNQFTGGTNVLSGTTNWLSLGELPPGTRTVSWLTNLTILPGLDTMVVRSVDLAANLSVPVTRYVTYVMDATVRVYTNGQGSVSPNLDKQLLEIGKAYRMTAKPARDWIFEQWADQFGKVFSQGPDLQFIMQADLQLTASFVRSPFTNVFGPYAGLIQDPNTNSPAPDGNGSVTLQVSESGAFSGRLRTAGRNHSFRGIFDHHGESQAIALRPSLTPIVLTLMLDWSDETGTIRGSATDGSWNADLLCHRNPYATGTNLCPRLGHRNFLWRDVAQSGVVAGSSLNVSSRGKVKAAATFLDGRKASVGTSISLSGSIPLAFSSDRFDSLLGWATVGLTGDSRVSGTGWLIPAATNSVATPLRISGLVP